ncbi:MAG: hypothetical protein ACI9OJ_001509 [Myxococcota bacterium]|jgi:hypothetical protein
MEQLKRVRTRTWQSAGAHGLGLVILGLFSTGCGDTLPEEVMGYRTRCIQMNVEPIEPTAADPHDGFKDVFACNVTLDQLRDPSNGAPVRPFPDGTMLVKESSKEGQDYPWLVATMEKKSGTWEWHEYTRNFGDEDFVHIVGGPSVCTDCHRTVEALDWVYTTYESR